MIAARLIVGCVAVTVLLIYAAGLLVVAIAGVCFHRIRIADIGRQNRISPLAVLLTCALLWPLMLERAVRKSHRG